MAHTSATRPSVIPLGAALGARIEGVHLTAEPDPHTVAFLQQALLEHHVVWLPGQGLDDGAHRALADAWDVPHPHPVSAFMGGVEVLASVENDAEKLPQKQSPDGGWHTDYTFHSHIADAAMLRAEICPPTGGDTMWASTHAAYDQLSDELKGRLLGLHAHHDLGPKFEFEMRRTYGDDIADSIVGNFAGAEHPIIAQHPVTGRPLLFVNPGYTRHVVGMDPAESAMLLSLLFAQLASSANTCRVHWQPGDLVIWDEHATVHQGPTDFAPHHRLLRRCTVGSRQPQPAPAP